MMIIATDAPVDARNLHRMAARAIFGLARTGSSGANGSGDFVISFSTQRTPAKLLTNDEASPLFLAVIEATEEAIINSLLKATTTTANGHTVEAIPLDRVREMYVQTKDIRLVRWLCNQADGFYIPKPDVTPDPRKTYDEHVFTETRGMVRDFSELLDTITESIETTQGISQDESVQIRQKWEDLKGCVERFVRACELGHYDNKAKPSPGGKTGK